MSAERERFPTADLETLNRAAQREGWWIEPTEMSIRRLTSPPANCPDPFAWTPPFRDDHEARVFVSERANRDLDHEPTVALHQLAVRFSRDWPETMLLANAVVRARRSGLSVPASRIVEAIELARNAANDQQNESVAWYAATEAADQCLAGFPRIAEIHSRLGQSTAQDGAAAAVLNIIADYVVAMRRHAHGDHIRPAAMSHDTLNEGSQEPPAPHRRR